MKKFLAAFFSIFIFWGLFSSCGLKKKELKVYSIIHDEETEALCNLFTKETGIKVQYLRATTGELVNRVIAEKNDPKADVLLGGGSSYHIQAANAGALGYYVPSIAKNFPAYSRSSDGTWTGFCVLSLGIGVNKKRFEKKFPNIAMPKNWEDLLNPAFKGEIVMTNPSSSSTAYLFVQNQLQRLGEVEGWKYLSTLEKLVGQFPDSGSAPPKLVGTGEYAIGIAYIHALSKYRAQGFDIVTASPMQTAGDVDCISILKKAKNYDSAKKFVDFILGKEAQELMTSIDFTVPVNPEAAVIEGCTRIEDIDLIDYDSKKAAAEKKEVLERWSKLR
ncbi:ABC transporter substrate-binding protein [Treponema pectinovorum]|uniref:ABC transporter substrate-binding protein n=1 Tax=Treponema pectinovorum TaxID=164 RepID=UPI0011C81A74|nr:ABC transporter substrate-binding protein [Treponema pectinovorum]